ncbi:ubiquinone biosynthesis hydroxylase [Phreatobacter cathodiphilus]|uniref:2-octaprenyl-6-methoxyphenyl hydroxylase n=1 Tax=Phreatobacter cathodiphilus TaxID=1868589 RepID=A0A2S0NG57_9HYPH|nr:ubiquinone biosynthesis hydroxylase [Phreatobacter cathodiphilus]AVO47159.1 2-octaprenyl-6-methoxyphenyl hydroxylase [Phreatobacter cathodiphilus]
MNQEALSPARTAVLIAGGGMAGLSLAVALKSSLGPSFSITVADPALATPPADVGRASAFAAAARRMFEATGAWEAIAPEAQPILDMVVTDSRTLDVVRPVFLTFDGEVAPGEPFAHMAPNAVVTRALWERAKALGVTLAASSVAAFEADAHETRVTLADGRVACTPLLVACDGGRSRLRDLAGIRTVGWDYGQSGIVCTVGHEHDHEGRAEEHFLPAGPFAILPLTGRRSSIVWTEESGRAERLCRLPAELFLDELETRFGHRLGEIRLIDKPAAYPLGLKVARDFVGPRLALVGDAAHVIHPIAGQGINMGFRDVAALAECIADAARLGMDHGAGDVLDRYQRWRRFDTAVMGVTTDGLNRLFSNGSQPLRFVRDLGLGLVDRMPGLKSFFIRQAAGITGEVPKLLRGQTP